MDIRIIAIINAIVAAFWWVKKYWSKLEKILTPIIEITEQLALDGAIDRSDRKKICYKVIKVLEEQKIIKISFFTKKIIIPILINIIAEKLPNFYSGRIKQLAKEIGHFPKDS